MLEAYRRYITFHSKEDNPKSGMVYSVGEDVKGISAGDIIFHFDYAPLCIDEDLGYFAVNLEHVVAVEKNINKM
jgi:hypothetical protein